MTGRFPHKHWFIATTILTLAVALIACSPFGKQAATSPAPTNTPPPTETSIPVLPTYTSTRVVKTPTATPTPTADEGNGNGTATPENPTPTPSPKPPEKVGADDSTAIAPVTYKVTQVPTIGDVIQNGSFEEGFGDSGVAQGWNAFDNGSAVYTWVQELQPMHISHGTHGQLMRIMGPGEPDRFVGIYQTVGVVPGETYTLTLHGMIRSSTATHPDTPYGHRVQWAIDYEGKTDWHRLSQEWAEWTDPGWNDVMLDDTGAVVNAYVNQITAETDKLTLFIRGWTKWPLINSEAKYYTDGVFLQGPVPGEETVIKVPSGQNGGGGEGMPTTGGGEIWIPVIGLIMVLGFAFWEIRKVRVR